MVSNPTYQNTLDCNHIEKVVTAPGESLSQRVFASENNNARETFQILIGARNPVILLIAPPSL